MRGGGLLAATAVAALLYAPGARAQSAVSPTVFTVATQQGPVSASEADLAHWLHIARRTVPGQPTLQDLQLEAMDTLLSGVYLRAEAQEEGISVTDRDVAKSLNRQRPQLFPHLAQYRRYLRETGQTRQDLLERVRQDLLAEKLKTKAIQPALAMVTPLTIADYVADHPRFVPERRDVLIIFTAHRNDARAAYRAVAAGEPFPQVAQRYSLDVVTKARGGFSPKLTRTSVEPKLGKVIFAAHKLRLEGPVRTKFGYYVFAVTRIYPRRAVTHARQVETATVKLRTQAETDALNAYAKAFDAKWSARTTCAPRFAFNPRCANHT